MQSHHSVADYSQVEENHNFPSNTRTKSDPNHQQHGFFGSTRAIKPDSSKVSGTSQTKSKSQAVRILRLIYLDWSKSGCRIKIKGTGFVSSIIRMTLSFSVRPRWSERKLLGKSQKVS